MNKEFLKLCDNYQKVIIWGYGYLGRLIHHVLNSNNIFVDIVWDQQKKQYKDVIIVEPFHEIEISNATSLVIVCVGKRIAAEQMRQEVMDKTNFDCILAIDYGYANKADRLSMLEFNLNIGCSLNCKYCPQEKIVKTYCERYGNSHKHLTFDEFRYIVDSQLNPCALVSFSGMSEPFENPDFIAMAEYASDKGFRIFLNTTLMGMNEEKFLSLCKIDIEQIFLHIPDEENNSKFKVTDEYLDLLDRFINFFHKNIRRFSCHSKREDHRVTKIINQYADIEIHTGTDKLNDRAGNLAVLSKGEQHTGEVICTLGETSVFTHVVMPNGELALCCNDYGLEGKLGNLLNEQWGDICTQEGYRRYISGISDCDSNYICKKCDSACEKDWVIKHKYYDYYYEYSNYIRMLLRKNNYLNGLDTRDAYYFERLAKADHICLIGLENNIETNAFFDNGWNSMINAEFYSDSNPYLGLKQIQNIRYIALDDIDQNLKWVMLILADKNKQLESKLFIKGRYDYFYFSDFVQII